MVKPKTTKREKRTLTLVPENAHSIPIAVLNFDSGEVEIYSVELDSDKFESDTDERKVDEFFGNLECSSSSFYIAAKRRGESLTIREK